MQDRMEESKNNDSLINTLKKMENRERDIKEYRDRIALQEMELDEYRFKLKQEQLIREKEIQKELEAREKFFSERERKLFTRQREAEELLLSRQVETEKLKNRLEHEISKREAQLNEAMHELQLEKVRYNEESRKKLETKSKDYVADALETLKEKEEQFHLSSKVWSIIGALSLFIGLVFFGVVTFKSFESFPPVITWEFITFSIFKGLIAVLLFGALAKYSFLFSNSYMREALKNGDRRHAINFGKFYLESYGAAAEWSQVKEAFEHWNITGSEVFNKVEEAKFDATVLEKVASVFETIGKTLPETKKSKIV